MVSDRCCILYFFCDVITLQAAGTYLQCNGSTAKFGLYFNQIRFPGSAGMVLGMANLIASDGVFPANIASP